MVRMNLLLALAVMLFAACKSGPENPLPEEMPRDFRLEYFEGGGMHPESQYIVIRQDSLVDLVQLMGKKNRVAVANDADSFRQLYQELRELDVVNIAYRQEEEVFDRGGVSVWLSWTGKKFEISDAGLRFILEPDQPRFLSMTQKVLAYSRKAQQDIRKSYSIKVKNMWEPGKIVQLHVFVDRETALMFVPDSSVLDSLENKIELVPATYRVQVSGNRLGGSFWEQKDVEFDAQMRQLDILLYQDSVVYRKIND